MAKVRVHFTWDDGTADSFIVEGTMEEMRESAAYFIQKRGISLDGMWQEEIDG